MPSSTTPQIADAVHVDQRSAPVWRSWLTVFASAFVLYGLTAQRGAQWQDSGMHILRAVTADLYGSHGLALVHPLHHWLARCAASVGFIEPCFAITLISATAGAAAIANTFGCVWTLSGNRRAAFFAAGSLMLAHTFWQTATLVETYTLAAALLSGECWCLAIYAQSHRRGPLCSALFLNGLGVANHLLAGLTTPILVIVALHAVYTERLRVRHAAVAAGLWLLGSLPFTGLVLLSMLRSGDAGQTLHSALFGLTFADEVLNVSISTRMLLISGGFALLNFPNALLLLAAFGVIRAGRLSMPVLARRALLAAMLIHVLFAIRYKVVDQHVFFIPAYVVTAIFGGLGYSLIDRNMQNRKKLCVATTVMLAVTPVLYAITPTVARRFDVLRSVERNKPYREDYDYLFTPWSVADRSAEQMSRNAVELAGESGLIVVEDSMAVFAVRYSAIRHGHPGLEVLRDATEVQLESAIRDDRPVVCVPRDRTAPQTELPRRLGRWEPAGDLFILDAGSAGR